METLSDLTQLAEFAGTRVPAAPLSSPCMQLFGQILTHPSRVTFPWSPLRHALFTYFGPSSPTIIDPNKIGAGWCGLSLILTAFKRLEVVESEEETAEVLTWLNALKLATIRRSLAFEITTDSTLKDVFANLIESIPSAELGIAVGRHGGATSKAGTNDGTNGDESGGVKRSASGAPAGSNKKRKGDGYNNDESSNSSSNEDDDEDEYLESKPRGVGGRGSSSRSRGGRPSQKVQDLSQRLSDVTGIPLIKCLETISKIPIEELGRIDPNAPIPTNYLPQGMNGHAAGLLGSALVGNNPSLSSPGLPLSSTVSSSSTLPLNTTNSSSTPKPPPKPKAPRKSSSSAHADSPAQLGPDGLPIKKATRTQRPHDPNRPNFSYSALIGQAILNHPEKRLRLAEIYDYVTSNYSYYKKNECGWQNSIRHNLSLQPVFKKVPDIAMPGKKGCFWTIIPAEEWRFANGGWMKMEKGAGGSHGKKKSADSSGGGGSKKAKKPVATTSAGGEAKKAGSGSVKSEREEDDDDDDDDEEDDEAYLSEGEKEERRQAREQRELEEGGGQDYSDDE